MESSYLTSKQVCNRLAISADTLRRWVNAGQLTVYRTPGGGWRFRPEDIDGLYTKQEPTPA